jgi:uncharacterized membrane protein YeaQ/YmgE (transglycosylase-associated protein family)
MIFATLGFHPEIIAAWLAVGLAIAWLAGLVMGPASYGVIGDFLLGPIGALVGAVLVSLLVAGEPEFWVPLLVAFLGACLFIVVARVIAARQNAS